MSMCPLEPVQATKWFPNQAARSADTLRTGRRAGTPNPGQALPPHCPDITRASVHAPPFNALVPKPASLSLWKESGP